MLDRLGCVRIRSECLVPLALKRSHRFIESHRDALLLIRNGRSVRVRPACHLSRMEGFLETPPLGYIRFSFLIPTFVRPRYSLILRPPARKNAPTRNAPCTSAPARSVQHADRYMLGVAAQFRSPGESVRHRARLHTPTEYRRQWDPAGSAVDDDRG
jgi:hypothetical protein